MERKNGPIALVTGFTIHGLAVARALSARGIEVHAFAQPGGWQNPTHYSSYATVHVRDNLNSETLVDHLLAFAADRPAGQRTVLFPTSDRMTAAIAEHWDRLRHHYLLSWAHCRDLVLSMQLKDSLPALAERAGIPHPRSVRIANEEDCAKAAVELTLPCIVKPVRPLSKFKAVVCATSDDLRILTKTYAGDLPFIAQDIIDGEEGTLYACTTFLDHGRELCMLTSRKLAASPPGLGQGTIFATEANPEIEALSRRFLAGLDLSGPVALEFKRDTGGRYWMIEPNVGRTEYCVDLAIQCGIDLPWIEYCQVTGITAGTGVTALHEHRTWFDTDKDPLCYVRNRRRLYGHARLVGAPVFPFWGHNDWKPLFVSTTRLAMSLVAAVVHKVWNGLLPSTKRTT